MRYDVRMDSPCMTELLSASENWITQLHTWHLHLQTNYGRGHELTIAMGRRVASARMALTELKDAVRRAEPEKAQGTFDNATMQVGDALANVYGRPRNDPRNPRVKRSHLKRQVA